MKLELGIIPIRDIRFGSESRVEGGTVTVNKEELKAILLGGREFEVGGAGSCTSGGQYPYYAG